MVVLDIIFAIITGAIEGVTEFLPISSTGHLLLFQNITGREQSELFNVLIQVFAVLAVVPLFKERIASMFRWKEAESRDLFLKTAVAFGLTGFLGLVFKKLGLELPDTAMPIAIALLVGGIAFVILEKKFVSDQKHNDITWKIVMLVVVGQVIAMVFPGASRSGSTIILMLIAGLGRERATEFSFLVGIPTMLAAGGYEIFDAIHDGSGGNENLVVLSIASIFSAITAFASVKWLLGYIKQHTFVSFGYYRIGAAFLLFILIALGIMQ